jgi:gas vesicle protein
MEDEKILTKLKQDIKEKKESYQKEISKIKEENNLLGYIKGVLDITKQDVSNFPYYNKLVVTEDEHSYDNFKTMLKYTLKEDKIIASFEQEIKNLYYLHQIGYENIEQYQEIKEKLNKYRDKIEEVYKDLVKNNTLQKMVEDLTQKIEKLDSLEEKLVYQKELVTDDIVEFYQELKLSNLTEKELTSILLLVFKNNLKYQLKQERIEEDSFLII